MRILKNKFPKLVVEEAKNIKKNATQEEIQNLDFDDFNPQSPLKCVYGQLSGNCHNSRAIELIENCAKRVYHIKEDENGDTLPGNSTKLNGSAKKLERHKYWSPIEVFIYQAPDQMNEKLIKFIKGEIKRLPS